MPHHDQSSRLRRLDPETAGDGLVRIREEGPLGEGHFPLPEKEPELGKGRIPQFVAHLVASLPVHACATRKCDTGAFPEPARLGMLRLWKNEPSRSTTRPATSSRSRCAIIAYTSTNRSRTAD